MASATLHSDPATDDALRALADAEHSVLWLDVPAGTRPAARAPLGPGAHEADLLIIGGGYTGLWAALEARRRDPARDVLLVEGTRIADGGSGRNGGFCSASLTHGVGNGVARFGDATAGALGALGRENLSGLLADLDALGIDCDVRRTGEVDVAIRPHQVEWLREEHELRARHGESPEWLDAEATRARLDSPRFLAGIFDPEMTVTLHPAKLAWGLADAADAAGVRMHEGTRVLDLVRDGRGVRARLADGFVRARQVVIAGSGWPPLLPAVRRHVLPIHDYVLVTEPLDAAQLAAIGWDGREGFADMSNFLTYFRVTPDDRILWGGYDALYFFGGRTGRALEEHPATYDALSRTFFETFPQLRGTGLRFSHRWAGVIDSCSRFSVMFGTALRGRVSYAVGYTGLGVGASRFGAHAALDLLAEPRGELASSPLVASRPLPFPPEPFRWLAVQATRRALLREDETGVHGPWLRLLDRAGVGLGA